jgi:hypothetical protein
MLRDRAALAAARGDDPAALASSASLDAQPRSFASSFGPTGRGQLRASVTRLAATGSTCGWSRAGSKTADAVQAAELVLRRKGIVFDVQSMVNGRGTTLSADAAPGTRSRPHTPELSALLLRIPPEWVGSIYDNCRKHTARAMCTSFSGAAADYDPLDHAVTVEAVAASLTDKAALVEFVRIPDFDYPREDFDYPRTEWDASWRYLAFVLRRSGDLHQTPARRPEVEATDRVFRECDSTPANGWHRRRYAHLGSARPVRRRGDR